MHLRLCATTGLSYGFRSGSHAPAQSVPSPRCGRPLVPHLQDILSFFWYSRSFPTAGFLKAVPWARWFSNLPLVLSTCLGTRLLALDQTEARRCLSHLRCVLDQPLSRRRCPHQQDLCTGGEFQSYAFSELSCMCADRGCTYAWLGFLYFL